jgi:tetratricopeptide (TPR) repeat protein
MVHRFALALLFAAAPLCAQGEDPMALLKKADDAAVAAMHARADALAELKQYARALALRQEIVGEFAPGDEKALTALGFVNDGTAWHRDVNKIVLDRDLKADAKVKKLDADWERTQKDLAKNYEKAATALSGAGQQQQAIAAWRRLLRFRPGDPKAASAMQLLGFEGFSGTAQELALLRKSRAIRQSVEFLQNRTVPVTPIQGTLPLFDAAKVAAKGFRTEHFEVWGALPDEKLQLCAQWAERSLLLARTLFGTSSGEPWQPKRILPFCWVNDRKTYQQVLEAHKAQFEGKDRLKFLEEDVALAFVYAGPGAGHGSTGAEGLHRLLVNTTRSDDELIDQTVRGVVQDGTLFTADGLWEGIGHAMCGFFFNRTLTFFIEQAHGRTATGWQPRPLMPDLKIWMEIAAESAWAKNDTPAARLVVLQGAKFTNEERVKAWAMVDWLLRSAPELLLDLEASKPKQNNDPAAVEQEFQRLAKLPTRQLDEQWRDYWGKGQALRAAMAAPPRGNKEEVAGAKAVATAIDEARAAADCGPLGWYYADNGDVQSALKWLESSGRAAAQPPKADAAPPPAQPECVGRSVLLAPTTDPAAAVAQWVASPPTRDLLLHPGRILIGASKGKAGIALDLAEPAQPTTRGLPLTWPRAHQTVPAACAVGLLPPWLRELLQQKGRQPGDEVGMPVSLHFHRELPPTEISAVSCRLTADREEVDGVFACVQRDGPPSEAANGCFVFVPLEPLKKNRMLAVEWTVPPNLLEKRQRFPRVEFAVQ